MMKQRKGQAFFYGLIGIVFAFIFFGAVAPFIQNAINAIAPTMSVNTQIMMGLALPVIALAILLGFWKAINPSGV